MVTEKEIQKITRIIVDTVHPKKVYLIGSYATGTADEYSDLDFLIIAGSDNLPKYERTVAIQKNLFDFPTIPIDLLLFTQAEVDKKKENKLTFIGDALRYAKVLYES